MIETLLAVIAGLIGYGIYQNRRSVNVSTPSPTPIKVPTSNTLDIPHYITFQKYSEKWNVPLRLFIAIVETESNFDRYAINPEVLADKKKGRDVDSVGLGQILWPDTAKVLANRVGVALNRKEDLFDADLNLNLAGNLLNELLRRFPTKDAIGFNSETAAAYNAGKPIYKEGKLINQSYVDKARRNWIKYGGI